MIKRWLRDFAVYNFWQRVEVIFTVARADKAVILVTPRVLGRIFNRVEATTYRMERNVNLAGKTCWIAYVDKNAILALPGMYIFRVLEAAYRENNVKRLAMPDSMATVSGIVTKDYQGELNDSNSSAGDN